MGEVSILMYEGKGTVERKMLMIQEGGRAKEWSVSPEEHKPLVLRAY